MSGGRGYVRDRKEAEAVECLYVVRHERNRTGATKAVRTYPGEVEHDRGDVQHGDEPVVGQYNVVKDSRETRPKYTVPAPESYVSTRQYTHSVSLDSAYHLAGAVQTAVR